MPTYEYECRACHHTFDLFQQMTDRAVRKCPKCGKLKVRRLISSGAGILFKGSGFYQTDYRSESYKKKADSEKSPKESAKPASGDGKKPGPSTPAETKPPASKSDKAK